MFTMVVPGEGGGGSIHVDIRGIMLIFKTVVIFSIVNLPGVCCHYMELKLLNFITLMHRSVEDAFQPEGNSIGNVPPPFQFRNKS